MNGISEPTAGPLVIIAARSLLVGTLIGAGYFYFIPIPKLPGEYQKHKQKALSLSITATAVSGGIQIVKGLMRA